jgi:phosphoribosyl-dephospho-CoA transferase
MNANQPLNIDVSVMDESPDEILTALKEAGAENVKEVKQRGFTGIEIVLVGTLLANALANLIIRLTPLWKCGVVVDARGSRILTKKDCDLARGVVLVISPDGTQSKFHQPAEADSGSLIKAFAGSKSP